MDQTKSPLRHMSSLSAAAGKKNLCSQSRKFRLQILTKSSHTTQHPQQCHRRQSTLSCPVIAHGQLSVSVLNVGLCASTTTYGCELKIMTWIAIQLEMNNILLVLTSTSPLPLQCLVWYGWGSPALGLSG